MDIGWKLRRLGHLVRRIAGSIAIRGWRGTVRRALRPRLSASPTDATAVSVRPPAPGYQSRRILIIDSLTPDPTRDSGSMRLCQIFTLLNEDGWTIDFIADDGDATAIDAQRLAALGVQLRQHPVRWLSAHGANMDVVMLCRLPIADQYLDLVRRHATRAQIVFDTVDLHFIREQRAADLNGAPSMARQARRSRRRELKMVENCDVTLVVSEDERQVLSAEARGARVEVVSNIHQVHRRERVFEGRDGILFVGGFGHPPNEDAVRWFISQVLPLVQQIDPTLLFHVVGDIDPTARRSIERNGIIVHGRVPDLTPLFEIMLISVAPLRFGAGVKGKVNQAMSFGVPVVLTGVAAEGMYLVDGVDSLIVDDAAGFAEAILRLRKDPSLWLRLSNGGQENVRRHFSLDEARKGLRNALTGR